MELSKLDTRVLGSAWGNLGVDPVLDGQLRDLKPLPALGLQ